MSPRRNGLLVLLALTLAATGCLDVLTGVPARGRVAMMLVREANSSVPLVGERVDVTITGAGIATPIFGSFRFVNDTARAELQAPAGRDLNVFVAVFDSSNTLVASGEATVVVGAGIAVSVPISVAPTTGTQPIIVTVGNTTLSVSPGSLNLTLGAAVTLAVQVRDETGALIPDATPSFASSNPAIAAVSPTGTVTAQLPGVTAITVTALGVAARIPVSVSSPLFRSP